MAKKYTLGEVVELYEKNVTIHKKGWQQEHYRAGMIKRHKIASMDIKKIKSHDIEMYKKERLNGGLSGNTVRIELSLISAIFKYAINILFIYDKNPVAHIQKPKVSKGRERRLLTKEERLICEYYTKYNITMYYIFILALETAMRQSEILGLEWGNIDFKKSVAYLPETKNGSERYVPLSKKARLILSEMPRTFEGKIFSYTSNSFKSRWRKDIKNLGIEDLHFHDLRHEAISRFFELGTLNVMEVASISGHKSLASLKRYTHLKAHKLVKKLNAQKRKVIAPDISFSSFPAKVIVHSSHIELHFLDFDDIKVSAHTREDACRIASSKLLHKLACCFHYGLEHPSATRERKDGEGTHEIIMINPLAVSL